MQLSGPDAACAAHLSDTILLGLAPTRGVILQKGGWACFALHKLQVGIPHGGRLVTNSLNISSRRQDASTCSYVRCASSTVRAQVRLGLPPLQCSDGASSASRSAAERKPRQRLSANACEAVELDRCEGRRLESGGCACSRRDPCSPIRRAQHFVQLGQLAALRHCFDAVACCVLRAADCFSRASAGGELAAADLFFDLHFVVCSCRSESCAVQGNICTEAKTIMSA